MLISQSHFLFNSSTSSLKDGGKLKGIPGDFQPHSFPGSQVPEVMITWLQCLLFRFLLFWPTWPLHAFFVTFLPWLRHRNIQCRALAVNWTSPSTCVHSFWGPWVLSQSCLLVPLLQVTTPLSILSAGTVWRLTPFFPQVFTLLETMQKALQQKP